MPENPHDAIFKWTFSQAEHAACEFRRVLPQALVERLDFDSLRLEPGSFVDEELLFSHSDLLYSVRLAGRRAFIYVLFEHQSSPDPLMPLRLLCYATEVWKRYVRNHTNTKTVPALIPLVLHHGESGWTAARDFHSISETLSPARRNCGRIENRENHGHHRRTASRRRIRQGSC